MTAGPPDLDAPTRDRVDAIVGLVRGVLGEGAIAGWLHGSAVLGGLRPRSDVDVLAMTGRPTTAGERAALVRELLRRRARSSSRSRRQTWSVPWRRVSPACWRTSTRTPGTSCSRWPAGLRPSVAHLVAAIEAATGGRPGA